MTLDVLFHPPGLEHPEFAILGLHGRNANGSAFLPFVRQMNFPRTRWVLPSAPYAAPDEHDVRWWFEHEDQNVDEIARSRAQLTALIDTQVADGVAPENVFLIGFSQGAVMTVDVALRYPRRLGGIVPLSGYIAHADLLAVERHPANRAVPVFLAHGTRDDVLPIDVGRRNRDILTGFGSVLDYREYETGHRISAAETRDIRAFLYRHMYGMSPDDPRLLDAHVIPF